MTVDLAVMDDAQLGKSEWAAGMAKTHKQQRCSGCGLWAIWVPKGRVR